MAADVSKDRVKQFWTELYRSAYGEVDATLDHPTLRRLIDEREAMFRTRRHLAVTEMPIDGLSGRLVFEVGPGAGGHAALFIREMVKRGVLIPFIVPTFSHSIEDVAQTV